MHMSRLYSYLFCFVGNMRAWFCVRIDNNSTGKVLNAFIFSLLQCCLKGVGLTTASVKTLHSLRELILKSYITGASLKY